MSACSLVNFGSCIEVISSDIDAMLLTTTRWRRSVVHVKKTLAKVLSSVPCHLHLQHVLDQPVCSMLYILDRPDTQFMCMCIFCDVV